MSLFSNAQILRYDGNWTDRSRFVNQNFNGLRRIAMLKKSHSELDGTCVAVDGPQKGNLIHLNNVPS